MTSKQQGSAFSIATLLVLALSGCADTVESGLTGLDLTVKYDSALGLDQLRFAGTANSMPAFPDTNFPNPSRPLAAGEESLIILLDESLDGQQLNLRADGLVSGVVAATEGLSTQIVSGRLTLATITLGEPAVCGDGLIRDGIEECDDTNSLDDDGCSASCQVEDGWRCLNDAGQASTCTELAACENGIDDDSDGRTDYNTSAALSDPGCSDPADTSEKCSGSGCPLCDNDVDDDGDGRTDFHTDSDVADPGCSSPDDVDEKCAVGASCPQCDDGVDNDGDNDIDLLDASCAGPTGNDEGSIPTNDCNDGTDNDGDGLTDFPDDPGCTALDDPDDSERCPDQSCSACDDDADNDFDGKTDYVSDGSGDPGCTGPTDASEREPGDVCDDGSDNDGDGLIDFPSDLGCATLLDDTEICASPQTGCPECDDGSDNDGDGLLDRGEDDGCASATDTSEAGLCTASCAATPTNKSCSETCSNGNQDCDLDCPGSDCRCDLDCNQSSGTCTVNCSATNFNFCTVDCRDTGTCDATCDGALGACYIDCTNADTCQPACGSTSGCQLDCTGATTCGFVTCSNPQSCANNITTCNLDCP